MKACSLLRALSLAAPLSTTLPAVADLPVVPVGYDAYRQWDRWPQQHIGVRAYLSSTYDRTGGNEGADASHFLYQSADDFNVALDVNGPGILYFVRYNHWHGSPWHYMVDGHDYLVQETRTADPLHPAANSIFLPEKAFPSPLALTWSATKGADLSWVPVPFADSFQMAYSRTHYGTGYYIYDRFVGGIPLSERIRSWTTNTVPPDDVLKLIAHSGEDLLPATNSRAAIKLKLEEQNGSFELSTNQAAGFLNFTNGPEMIRALEFSVPRDQAIEFGHARLRVTWDDRSAPSIDTPVALFFGTGTLYNRDGREYLVKAFPVHVRFDDKEVHLACYFPMPFFHTARFELVTTNEPVFPVHWSVRSTPCEEPANHLAYFHATYRDMPQPEPGRDLLLLDTRETEGGGDWSGQFIGTSFIFSDRANLTTLEGDPRFFFDDSQTPQAQGTGTEEWGGGGDYWGGQTMTLPFAGHPTGARKVSEAKNDEDKIESAYRFLLADLMPFGRNAVIRLEHGGEDQSTEHYQTVAFWYGLPAASLVKTDELKIGDTNSEAVHQYHSPQASAPYEIVSRYEWGVDKLGGKEVFPAESDWGRKTSGTSEFTLQLAPDNFGVLLRRKLDYQFPNQRAEVFVSDADRKSPRWRPAGVWYLAGGNTCVYSNPKGELGATEHRVETSNRRFRDDEFLISRRLTEGRSAIRVKVQFQPVEQPLFPGQPLTELAWSEIKYSAYCFKMPAFQP
ncbi:MAG TPA: DUF2961 domain-containing protein [Candidatus Sulfotelmatobacter sp.]|jgi:hypothetical protein|nr:DUF2961 domain-containing protein [Candidatus Sulfotelmatobacter sp.]